MTFTHGETSLLLPWQLATHTLMFALSDFIPPLPAEPHHSMSGHVLSWYSVSTVCSHHFPLKGGPSQAP